MLRGTPACAHGQQVSGNLQHRQPRQRIVAEAMGSALSVDRLNRRRNTDWCVPAARGQLSALIVAAIQIGKTGRHFLKAEHVGVRHNFAVETIRARSTTPSQPLPH